MAQKTRAAMIIRFVSGKELRFAFDREEDQVQAAQRIQEALSAQNLVVELPDRAMVIPISNIEIIEVYPPPPKWPRYAVRNARVAG
jgi:hypothetical protein